LILLSSYHLSPVLVLMKNFSLLLRVICCAYFILFSLVITTPGFGGDHDPTIGGRKPVASKKLSRIENPDRKKKNPKSENPPRYDLIGVPRSNYLNPANLPKQKAALAIDPIRFTLQSNKSQVEVGEEFEITITAQLLDIPPSLMFFFEEQKSFVLKMLLPTGFEQTGGSYYDLVNGKFSNLPADPVTYTIKGRFTQQPDSTCFTLLRSTPSLSSQDKYVKLEPLCLTINQHLPGARVAAGCCDSPPAIPVIYTDDQEICVNNSITLSAYCSSGLYNWVKMEGGSPAFISNSSSFVITPSSTGTYTYRLECGRFGCPDCYSERRFVNIQVNGGCACGSNNQPTWVNDGNAYCENGRRIQRQVNNNACSPTHGTLQWIDQGTCGCEGPTWINDGNAYCENGRRIQRQVNNNACSPTHGTLQWIDQGTCGCEGPNWVNDGNAYCDNGRRIQRQVNNNACSSTNGAVQFIDLGTCGCEGPTWVNDGNAYCENGRRIQRQVNNNACSSTNGALQYIDLGGCCSSIITISASPATVVCAGTTVILTVVGCTGSLAWTNGFSTPSISVTPGSTTSYTATCTQSGCTTLSKSQQITVNPIPPIPTISAQNVVTNQTVSPSAGQQTVELNLCPGNPMRLTATGCTAGVIKWSDGSTGNTLNVGIPPAATNYTAICELNGCTSGNSYTVRTKVISKPTISISKSLVCKGEVVTLTAANVNANLSWSNGVTSNPNSFTANASVTIQGVNFNDTNTCQVVSDPVSLTVVDLQLTASQTTVCPGTTLSLTATGCGGTLSWAPTGGTISGNVYTVTAATTTTYSVTCSTASCSKSQLITVRPQETVVSASNNAVCGGTSALISATSTSGGTFRWSGPNGFTSTQPSATVTIPGDYQLTVTYNSCLYPVVTSVIFTPPTAPTVVASKSTICPGESAVLTASGCVGTIVWSTNSTGNSLTAAPLTTTSYTARCQRNSTCTGPESSSLTITVTPFSAAASKTVVCSGEAISLTATCCQGVVEWSNGMTGTSISAIPLSATTYTARCVQNGQTLVTAGPVSVSVIGPISYNGDPTVSCAMSGTINKGNIDVPLSGSVATVTVQYKLEKLVNTAYVLVNDWTTNANILKNLDDALYRVTVRGVDNPASPLGICLLPSKEVNVRCDCGFGATASSLSILAGGDVGLSIEGAPFNSGNGLLLNGATFNASFDVTQLHTNFTWEAWVKPVGQLGSVTNSRYVLYPFDGSAVGGSTHAGVGVAVGTDGVQVVEHTTSYLQEALRYNTAMTTWTHLAVVYENNIAKIYLNGVLKAERTVSNGNKIVHPSNYLGGHAPSASMYGYYNGYVDEVRVWGIARPAVDILRDYQKILSGRETDLAAYWRFESFTGNRTVPTGQLGQYADLSGNYQIKPGNNTDPVSLTAVYTWASIPAGFTATGPSVVATPAQSTTYVVSRSDVSCVARVSVEVQGEPCSFSVLASSSTIASGQSTTLTVTNGVLSGGKGVRLNGSAGSTIQPSLNYTGLSTNFTWEAWVWPESGLAGNSSGQQYVLFPEQNGGMGNASHAGMGVAVGTDGVRILEHADSYLRESGRISQTISGWTHIAVVYQNNAATVYINGVASTTATPSPGGKIVHPSTTLGGGVYGYYRGKLDEVRVWNTARTGAEISADYTRVLSGAEPNLQTYWRFETLTGGQTSATVPTGQAAQLNGTVTAVDSYTAPKPVPGSQIFAWNADDGSPVGTGSSISVTPGQTTTYSVRCTNCTGCTVPTIPITVTGSTNLRIVTQSPASLSLCAGSSLTVPFSTSGTFGTGNIFQVLLSDATGDFTNAVVIGSGSTSPISVSIPASATTGTGYRIKVNSTNPFIKGSVNGSPLSINTPPVLTLSNATICAGQSASLDATGCSGTLRWSTNTTTASITVSPATTTTYSATCTLGGCSVVASTTVTVNPKPTVTASVASSTVCEGSGTINLNTTATGGTTPYSYRWQGPNGFTSTTQNPTLLNALAAASGSYTVVVTGANGCSNTAISSTVTVQPCICNPTAGVSSPTVCVGATASLTANSGFTTYSWRGPAGFTASGASITLPNATTTLSGLYTLTVTGTNSCTGVAVVPLVVTALPIVAVNSATICGGQSTNLVASGCSGTLKWNTGATTASLSLSPTSTTFYSVTCTANGCNSVPGSATVTVNPRLTATASVASATVCEGSGTISLSAGATGGSTPYSYLWRGPNSFTSTAQNPAIPSAVAAASGSYTVVITSTNGCSATTTTSAVTVQPCICNPMAGASASAVCVGTTVSLTANSGFTSYSWRGPAGFTASGASVSLPNATTAMSGSYTLTVTGSNSCTGVSIVPLTVNASPVPVATVISATVCSGSGTIALNTSVTGGTAPYSYIWRGPNSFTSTAQNPTLANAGSAAGGSYTVVVTSASGCSATALSPVVTVSTQPTKPTLTAQPAIITATRNVTLTAGGCAGTIHWTTGSTATGSVLVVSISQTTTFAARCQLPSGCVSDTAAITVLKRTINAPIITTSATSLCQGDSLTLRAMGCETGMARWSNGMTGDTIRFVPTATSSYTALCRVDGIDGEPSNALSVLVLPRPTSLTITASQADYAVGQTLSLTATASGAVRYVWFGPAGFTATGQTLSRPSATLTMSGTYTAVAYSSTAVSCPAQATRIVSVTAVSGPFIATLTPSPLTVCGGSTLTVPFATTGTYGGSNLFQVLLSDATGDFTNAVVIGSGTTSPISATVPATAVAGSGYRVRVSSSEPFVTGVMAIEPITIQQPLSATASTSSPAQQQAVGDTVQLTAAVHPPVSVSYQWSGPGGFTSNVANPTIPAATSAANGTYTVLVTGAGYCSTTATTTVALKSACPLAFDGNPVADCDSAATDTTRRGRITVQVKNPTVGAQLHIALYQSVTAGNQTTYQLSAILPNSPAVFTGLQQGTYRIDAYEVMGSDTCKAGSRMVTVDDCDFTVSPCDIRIKAIDSQDTETDVLPRTGGQLGSLQLSVEHLEGAPLSGFNYEWSRTTGTSAAVSLGTSSTLSATAIGEYSVKLMSATDTCRAYLTVRSKPCTPRTHTYACGTTPAIPLPDNGSRLSNLAVGDTIRAADFDIIVTEVLSGGPDGWNGVGYTEIPYLKNTRIAIDLKGVVVNGCYELVGGTAQSAYDPNWGGVTSVDSTINNFEELLRNTIVDARYLANNYDDSKQQKEKANDLINQISYLRQQVNNSSLTDAEKQQAIAALSQLENGLAGLANGQCSPNSPNGRVIAQALSEGTCATNINEASNALANAGFDVGAGLGIAMAPEVKVAELAKYKLLDWSKSVIDATSLQSGSSVQLSATDLTSYNELVDGMNSASGEKVQIILIDSQYEFDPFLKEVLSKGDLASLIPPVFDNVKRIFIRVNETRHVVSDTYEILSGCHTKAYFAAREEKILDFRIIGYSTKFIECLTEENVATYFANGNSEVLFSAGVVNAVVEDLDIIEIKQTFNGATVQAFQWAKDSWTSINQGKVKQAAIEQVVKPILKASYGLLEYLVTRATTDLDNATNRLKTSPYLRGQVIGKLAMFFVPFADATKTIRGSTATLNTLKGIVQRKAFTFKPSASVGAIVIEEEGTSTSITIRQSRELLTATSTSDGSGLYTTKIDWAIHTGSNGVAARPYGKGYWGKRFPQSRPRVDALELKINPNDESYYIQNSNGSFVQFEGFDGTYLKDGKCVGCNGTSSNSPYFIEENKWAESSIATEAKRQVDVATHHNLKIEWLVTDENAANQLRRFFSRVNIDIKVTYFAE
jgi:hypothetical protein